MLAVTIDLVLAIAAVSVVAALWFQRQVLKPQSVWEKLTVGATMVAFALIVRLADTGLAQMPWPIFAEPSVQAIVIAIGLIGGALAIAAGLADWIPGLVAQGVAGKWRHEWSRSQRQLCAELSNCDEPGRIIAGLVGHFRMLCETPRVTYCAYHQRTRRFANWNSADLGIPARWERLLNDVETTRHPVTVRLESTTIIAIPLEAGHRIYGAVVIERRTDHPALHETHLLSQTADRAARALDELVRHAVLQREIHVNETVTELTAMLGSAGDPTDELMAMLELAHREMAVEYAAALIFEGDHSYARRYSHYWNGRRLSERGLQIPLGELKSSNHSASQAFVTDRGEAVMTPATVPHTEMRYRLAVPLMRGKTQIGILVVASLRRALQLEQIDLMTRWAPIFATAVERVTFTAIRNKAETRLSTLGGIVASTPGAPRKLDRLTTDILDEIPGTFCQYMSVEPDRNLATVTYRRARREGWGHNTLGMEFDLNQLPNCRMVIDNGRSVLFRQDDPERHFDPQEAEQVFGAVPNSLLMIPVVQDGSCRAIMAVGEMREPNRNSYNAADRTFADSYIRLSSPDRMAATAPSHLDTFGDLNFTFAGPLTGILGSVEILKQQLQSDTASAKYLNVIERNADRIKGAVSELAEMQHTQVPSYVRRPTDTLSPVLTGRDV